MADPTLNANSEPPIGDTMFVGPTYGPENNNISTDTNNTQRGLWVTRIRNYGDVALKARGSATYGIGLKFGADEVGSAMAAGDIAGVDRVAQGNWNNILGMATPAAGPVGNIVADANGTSQPTSVTVDWTSPNTWASEGPRGEENNALTNAADEALMTGYLDSGAATTTQVKLAGIPTQLTSTGYDVYVYLLGGVGGGRGGGYRVTDSSGTSLTGDYVRAKVADNPTSFVQVPLGQGTNYSVGSYIVFTNLKSAAITVEASTDNGLASGATPRAPINAIQLVPTGSGGTNGGGGGGPKLTAVTAGAGKITITWSGGGTLQTTSQLQSTGTVWTDVTGASSPATITASGSSAFYRVKQ